jgi:hypothetical protein
LVNSKTLIIDEGFLLALVQLGLYKPPAEVFIPSHISLWNKKDHQIFFYIWRISYICKKIVMMLQQLGIKRETKTYTRFNKEENVFEDIVLDISHRDRFKKVLEGYGLLREISKGDLVKVRDGSGNLDFYTGEKRSGIDPLFEDLALVTGTNLSFITEPFSGLGEHSRYVLDLLLLFPNGEKVYTSSTFIGGVIKDGYDSWEYTGNTDWIEWKRVK